MISARLRDIQDGATERYGPDGDQRIFLESLLSRSGASVMRAVFSVVQSVRLRSRTGRTTAHSPSFLGC